MRIISTLLLLLGATLSASAQESEGDTIVVVHIKQEVASNPASCTLPLGSTYTYNLDELERSGCRINTNESEQTLRMDIRCGDETKTLILSNPHHNAFQAVLVYYSKDGQCNYSGPGWLMWLEPESRPSPKPTPKKVLRRGETVPV